MQAQRTPSTKATLAIAALTALVFAATASAHAIVSPPVAKSKVLQQFTLSVPTEEANTTTTQIELTVPSGFAIDSFEPAPGWGRSRVQLIGSRIASVTWTGGSVPTSED